MKTLILVLTFLIGALHTQQTWAINIIVKSLGSRKSYLLRDVSEDDAITPNLVFYLLQQKYPADFPGQDLDYTMLIGGKALGPFDVITPEEIMITGQITIIRHRNP